MSASWPNFAKYFITFLNIRMEQMYNVNLCLHLFSFYMYSATIQQAFIAPSLKIDIGWQIANTALLNPSHQCDKEWTWKIAIST